MNTEHLPNRWAIAVAAVFMQVCLGAVYGWSVFKKPLMRAAALERNLGPAQLHDCHFYFRASAPSSAGFGRTESGRESSPPPPAVIYGLGYLIAASQPHHIR